MARTAYQDAIALIVEDPAVQGGAATFKGTRVLVHHIAGLLAQGVGEPELAQDYPQVTAAMREAALVYVKAHPERGRPRQPAWRDAAPLAETVYPAEEA